MKEILPLSSEHFGLFQELLGETCGLQFEGSQNQSLHLALWERLRHRGDGSYEEYYHRLKFHPEGYLEMRELLDLITIGETYFFRNRAQFEVLMRFVLPEIIQKKVRSGEKSLRIWSAGCSRGDEPYSIAIALMEVLPSYRDWHVSIIGTDVNRKSLDFARGGVYGEKDIAHLPKEYLEKYFKTGEATYHLHSHARELVQFEYHNLAKGPFANYKLQGLDLIFCRNVTIYFKPQTTRHVVEHLHACLAPGGYLFLGHTETLWRITERFEVVELPEAFIYRKRQNEMDGESRATEVVAPDMALEKSATERGQSSKTEADLLERINKSVNGALSFLPPGPNGRDKNSHQTLLTWATSLANEARYQDAADLVSRVIEADALSVDAHYLLGMLQYRSGCLSEAENQFRKVVYLAPDALLAYFHLGNIYRLQEKFRDATREFRNTIRLSENRPGDEQARLDDVTMKSLLSACRIQLEEISQRGG
jgi:chemotaxis protein methyltransferase CheR